MTTCLDCGISVLKIVRHVRDVHRMEYSEYLTKHRVARICHCGKDLPVQRNASHGGGRRRLHCSDPCTLMFNNWKRTYGLDAEDYWGTLRKQEGTCAICKESSGPDDRTLAVDHEHVDGYEDMSSEEKKKYFRGLLCNTCNRWRVAKNDLETARSVVQYLETYSSQRVLS